MSATRLFAVPAAVLAALVALAPPAAATPVCTDGYKGGAPLAACGNRIFPEAAVAKAYVQYLPNAAGFSEYLDGVAFMAQKYPRWVSAFTFRSKYGDQAVSAGPDGIRSTDEADTGDGYDILVVKITDHEVPDVGKDTLFFSLSVHGNERGGLEGGLRAAEDLAMAAADGGKISDGVAGYESNTGKDPVFHEYEVKDVLAKQAVYLVDFNIDGWAVGDLPTVDQQVSLPYERANGAGTDLNRQMPTVGRINFERNPLEEPEMLYGTKIMEAVAKAGRRGKMAYGADVHGELTSRAYVDIMYPAGEFDSVKHRQLMAIAERTKSVIDETLYLGIQNEIENQTGGDEGEGVEEVVDGAPVNAIPTKPAHWATVWDTLGYTDTGFIGDYLATDLAVTGMDYEIMLNHTVPDKAWNVYLQENHINATRAIVKTAMAYAMYQETEFNDRNVVVETGGQAGYVVNPDVVTDADKNGVGTKAGPDSDGVGAHGDKVSQASYSVTNQQWFTDTSRLMKKPFRGLHAADIANDGRHLDQLDTLVLADIALPRDPSNRPVNATAYWKNIRDWVQRGGNLVLTDHALHALEKMGVLSDGDVEDIEVYQPYSDISNFESRLVSGLRKNARQLVECPPLGYEIGGSASPMSVVDQTAFTEAGGTVVGTTGDQSVSVGELSLGKGVVRVVGGALPMPTEENDHRYGLRNYAMTYTGLFIRENAIRWDAAGLGSKAPAGFTPERPAPDRAQAPRKPGRLPATGAGWEMALAGLGLLLLAARVRRARRT